MSNSTLGNVPKLLPEIASLIVVLIAGLVVAGWATDSVTLKSLRPTLPAMQPNAAVGFLLGGVSLWLLAGVPLNKIARGFGYVLALLIAGLGVLALVAFDLKLGLVGWPFQSKHDAASATRRVAVSTAICFLLSGVALLTLHVETRRGKRPAEFLAIGGAVICLLILLTYGYGLNELYDFNSGMAIHTSVAFIVLSLGILSAYPNRGLMAVATSRSAGGFMLRRLMLAVIGVPSILGWLNIAGTDAKLYSREFGVALLVAANTVLLLIVIWRNGQLLHVMDTDRQRAVNALRESRDELETRVEARTAALTEANEALLIEIAERRRVGEELRRLQSVTDAVLSNLSLDELLREMLVRMEDLLGADAAAILLVTEDGKYLAGRIAIGLDEEARVRVPMGQGIAGRIALHRTPLIVDDLSKEEVVGSILFENVCSLIGAPLMVEDRVIGVIHVDTLEPHRFTTDDVRLLQLAADRVAAAIERTRLYEAEQRARLEAEAANRLKDDFLATISHELRSPLNSILGWVALLREGRLSEQATASALQTVERSARAQNRIISDLLDVARIVNGQLRLNMRMLEPGPIIEAGVEAVRPPADAKGVRIKMALDCSAGTIATDSDRLQQIVWNLVSNAIKFTPKGGTVEIRLERVGSQVELVVSDTGTGISPEFLAFVFDRFRQADSSSTRKQGGLGLGLAIVRHLVELHGGTIHAESEGAGKGARFVVRLPRARLSAAAREERMHAVPALDSARLESPPPLDGLKVLVVDEETSARDLMSAILQACDVDVRTAASAAEALSILADGPLWRPDVLVADIEMTRADDFELMRRLRTLPPERGGRVPAIALTPHARVEDRVNALAAGFQMHVPKPVELAELLTVLGSVTGRLARSTGPLSPL